MCEQCFCKTFASSGKILAKFYTVLSQKQVMSQFFVSFFLAYFGNLCYFLANFLTVWFFWAFYDVLSQIRLVVIYSLFWVKLFWLKPGSCKKLSVCISVRNVHKNEKKKIPHTGDTVSLDMCGQQQRYQNGQKRTER